MPNEQSSISTRENGEGDTQDPHQGAAGTAPETNGSSQGEAVAEEWRPVVGYEGVYEVSSLGNLRNIKRGRALAQCAHNMGYRMCSIARRRQLVHRVVCEAFHGPANGRNVNHKDTIKVNNHASNLEWCTQAENVAHAMAAGLKPRVDNRKGEANGRAIMTETQVMEMKKLRADGITVKEIAKVFGFSWTTTNNAIIGRTWKHLL